MIIKSVLKIRTVCPSSIILALLFQLQAYGLSPIKNEETQIHTGNKILIVVTNSDHLPGDTSNHGWGVLMREVGAFYGALYQHEIKLNDIGIVSPHGGPVPVLSFFDDFPGNLRIPEQDKKELRKMLSQTMTPEQVNPDDYHVIYYAGGFSCLVDFPGSEQIGKIASRIYERGGIVCATCDGVAGIIPIKLSNGNFLVNKIKITTNHYRKSKDKLNVRDQLKSQGAIIESSSLVSDHKVITARGVRPVQVAEEVAAILGLTSDRSKVRTSN